jgi:hypothetical protein
VIRANLLQSKLHLAVAGKPARFNGLSPKQIEQVLGKAPLRLVVKRTWHTPDSFTDTLDCGHTSPLQFTAFGYIEDQYIHRIQPTAKRRRCQTCKEAYALQRVAKTHKHDYGAAPRLGASQEARRLQRGPEDSRREIPTCPNPCDKAGPATNDGGHRLTTSLARLYQDAQQVIKKKVA